MSEDVWRPEYQPLEDTRAIQEGRVLRCTTCSYAVTCGDRSHTFEVPCEYCGMGWLLIVPSP